MKPILNLNKHPKDCENLSLVNAKNVRLSNDGSCLQSENKLIESDVINQTFNDAYVNGYNIINAIECNTELVIFVVDVKHITDKTCYADLWRFNESFNQCKKVYTDFNYNYGEIIGAFTYNVNNELIIAISEYDANIDVPLRTINLGKFEEDKEQLPNELLPINPEVYIPTLSDYNYVAGNLPKGWYYIFVRYKIDNVDYTKWFDVGGPILVDNLEKQSIFKLFGYKTKNGNQNTNFEPFTTGILDHFNADNEFSNEALDLDFINIDTRYKKYQIGVIYTAISNIKSFKTSDINIDINKYTLNIDNIEEYNYKDILLDSYNIYNSKCTINYKNRLYVSNYKENVLHNYDTSNIIVNLKNNIKNYNDLKTLGYYISENEKDKYLTLDDELDRIDTDNFENDKAEAHIYPNLIIDNVKYNDIISVDGDYLDIGTEPSVFTIKYRKDNKLIPQITEIYEDPLPYYVIRDVFKIKTKNNNILNIEFYLKQQSKYNTVASTGEGYFKYTVNNKTYITHIRTTSFNPLNDYIPCVINIINPDYITDDILIPKQNTGSYGTSVQYINTKNSFTERKKNSTLIPGEVYNFYIHFVDKYGFETKGFKLTPRSMLDGYVPVYLDYTPSAEFSNLGYRKYALMKPNTPIFSDVGIINIDACVNVLNVFTYLEYEKRMLIDLTCFIDIEGVKNRLLELYGSLKDNLDIKWEDVSVGNIDVRVCETEDDLLNLENIGIQYLPIYLNYYNKNNEALFKIPYSPIKVTHIDGIDQYGFSNINLTVKDVILPDGYCGYFLSYELFEETAKCTGILTKSDFNDTEHLNNSELDNDNKNKTSKMYFYCSDFDVFNNKLQYNILRIESKNTIKASKNVDVVLNGIIQNVANLNNPETESNYNYIVKYYNISDYNIAIANDTVKNRFGLSTCLELPIIDDLFNDDEINIYKVSLLYLTNNNYVSEDKQLIKCTNVIYPSLNNSFYPIQYLNGHNTYNNFIVYDSNKFIFNDGTNRVEAEKSKDYIDYGTVNAPATDKISKFLSYIQIPCFKNFFYETKSFKNRPTNIVFKITNDEGKTDDFAYELGCVVKPQNSIDLFENKFVHPDNYCPKFYTNHRTDIKYLEEFDKMIRRSDIIQDESYSNSWRRFGLENYKVISENKGKITNVVGIGYYLLVHTEHSLFAFNSSNTLKTLDKDIQLATPDIFDLDYQELITSELGYAGLQDRKAWCLDTFGYIFYDNDNERLFRFDEGKLDYIDGDIIQFLNKYKPDHVKFGVDKEANRILIKLTIPDIKSVYDLTLSYNYGINKFISFHDYTFDNTYNTKTKLYLLDKEYNKFYEFNYDNLRQVNYSYNKTQLEFIINDNYYKVKYLEYIIYRLFNIAENTKDYNQINNISPVEELRKPYSGIRIRVYNDEVDTGWLDISVNQESLKNVFANFNKPYWDKGNWNFSYLRDKDTKSRLYGNYFVVCFEFGGDEMRYEFETLGYNITKDRQI